MATEINTNAVITSINPANRQVIGQVSVTSPQEISLSVANAQKAFQQWRKTDLNHRLKCVETFRGLVFESKEELVKLITSETGKPRIESLLSEIFGILETCTWLQANARSVLSQQKVKLNPLFLPGKRGYNVQEPLGVIAVIAPWNCPFSIPVSTMLAALVAGNAVVLKPSPNTVLTAQAAVELFRRAGFPRDLVSLVQGDKVEAEALINSPINRVMFTGSVAGGRAIMALAARKLLPLTLELGGKHAAIVLPDCDIKAILRPLVWTTFTNCGQTCASIERLYVVKSIAPQLIAEVAKMASELHVGDGLLPDTDVGPLIDEANLLRVQELVNDAVAQGATVVAGGHARLDLGGFFFEPTVLTGVKPTMRVVTEEIFGPVLPIIEVEDENEAIAMANDSDVGLGASIWTKNIAHAEQLARQIDAGMVWINDGLYSHVAPDTPWGGIKNSGFGKMHSAAELRDLVYTKHIGVSGQRPQDWNHPYTQNGFDFLNGALEFAHADGLRAKVMGVVRLVRALLERRH